MKRVVLALLILVPIRLIAAMGDITGVAVRSDGWSADVYISGLNTNGTYSYGLGSNNALTGSERLRIALTSQGFDDTGTATTVPRTVVGTYRVRKPYPDNAAADETLDAGILRLRIALSDYVYAGDSNLVATLGAGLYSQGGTNSAAASSVTVTNSSTVAYPKVIANWSWPGWNRLGSTAELRVVAFHRDGRDGRPVRVVRVWMDGGGTNASATATTMEIDRSVGDAVAVPEYVARVSTAGFTNGTIVTTHFAAYPWIGDSASVWDTSTAGYAHPTPLPCPQTNVVDRTGAYGTTWAVVDVTTGNDGTGRSYTNAFDSGATNFFATFNAAAVSIRATNNSAFGRAEPSGVIYVKPGNYNFSGAATAITGLPYTWTEIKPYPGNTNWSYVITNTSGNKHFGSGDGGKIKLVGAKVTSIAASGTFDNFYHLWIDQCWTDSTSLAIYYRIRCISATRSLFTTYGQGFRGYGTQNAAFSLVRGNDIRHSLDQNVAYCALGNVVTDNAGSGWVDWFSSQAAPMSIPIIAFNHALNYTNNVIWLSFGQGRTNTVGGAIVQNLVEVAGPVTVPLTRLAADNTFLPGATYDNLIVWNNTMVGQRVNVAYNDAGSTNTARRLWSIRGNIFEDFNLKTDTFSPENSARIGNWSVAFGVGQSGNAWTESCATGGDGAFQPELAGVNAYQPSKTTISPVSTATNLPTWTLFVDRKANTGLAAGAGNGRYSLQSESPVQSVGGDWLLPFDIYGNARGRSDPPGAISSASPRKSGGFFP